MKINPADNPPLPMFDWRVFLPRADQIIAAMAAPRPPPIGLRHITPRNGWDLSAHRESLARFLVDVHESYRMALDDFEFRTCDAARKYLHPEEYPPEPELPYDYSEYAPEAAEGPTDEQIRRWCQRPRGNPGTNRRKANGAPPVKPLGEVFDVIATWWQTKLGTPFAPKFAGGDSDDVEAEPFERNNGPARFAILVAKSLDKNYSDANIRSAADTLKKQRKMMKKKTYQH